jgi:hypothetical protein
VLLKEIKELNCCNIYYVHGLENSILVILPKLIYSSNTISKSQKDFFLEGRKVEIDKLILKLMWKCR